MEQDLKFEMQKAAKVEEFKRKLGSLRYRLQGMAMGDSRWYLALDALEFGHKYHQGVRKDGMTPEYMHQVEQALYALTLLHHFMHPVETIIVIFLHDVREDYGVPHEQIEDRYGRLAANAVDNMTKTFLGIDRNPEEVFHNIALDPISSVDKGVDRIHNQSTMNGVFSLEKQIKYCKETREHFFKFLKIARRAFPQQELAYENIKFVLLTQVRVFEGANAQGIAA